MTVKDLVDALKELPQNLPVVSAYKEISDINLCDEAYVLEHDEKSYSIGPAVVLE